jgi:hypothetical protein
MSVVDRSIAGLQAGGPIRAIDRTGRTVSLRLAGAFTSAAVVTGLFEILLDRIAAPSMSGALGSTASNITGVVAWLGLIAVSATAVFVLLAVAAWSIYYREARPLFAIAALIAVAGSVLAGLAPGRSGLLVVHVSVAVAVVAFLGIGAHRESAAHRVAVWAVAVTVIAGQWTLIGMSDGQILGRVLGEAALVLAVVLLAVDVFRSHRGGPVPLLGLAGGAALAIGLLLTPYTPFLALWAAGATLWLPALFYVVAAAAGGYLMASSVSNRAARPLVAALILVVVAGLEPNLLHHSVTAMLALVTLGTTSVVEGDTLWR